MSLLRRRIEYFPALPLHQPDAMAIKREVNAIGTRQGPRQ
jgi:hypothetical protein